MKTTSFLLFAALLLGFIAYQRAPEYDEAYSLFLTAGDARPAWPSGVFSPSSVRDSFAGRASPGQISTDLKIGDVHPPLYFWLLEYWRRLFGPSWFTARLLSVVLSLGALAALAWLAEVAAIPVIATLAITVFSYGFAYTGIVARGFALAQCLNILGIALIFAAARNDRQKIAFAGGLALGAASFTNYLALFVGLAAILWLAFSRARWRLLAPAMVGIMVFFKPDFSYFAMQRHSRASQFAGFSPLHALKLLTKDSGAALFGGLPLYAGRAAPIVAALLFLLFLICLAHILKRRRNLLFALAAAAPLAGPLALGLIFHNTPIEIRYLAFSMPFLALLLAAALPKRLTTLLLGTEICAIIGLTFAPSTMQPQAAAAHQIAALNLPNALILVPFGNDGVGIPGPFIASLPDTARIKLLRTGPMPNLVPAQKIILATLSIDATSRAATARSLAYFHDQKCFIAGPTTQLTAVFLNGCTNQQP